MLPPHLGFVRVPSAREPLAQRETGRELVDEIEARPLVRLDDEVVFVPRDHRMIQRREHARLSFEELDGLPVARLRDDQTLERDVRSVGDADRLEGLAAAPLAERSDDAITIPDVAEGRRFLVPVPTHATRLDARRRRRRGRRRRSGKPSSFGVRMELWR